MGRIRKGENMRTVRTHVSRKLFESMLKLPEGVCVHSVHYEFMTGSFQVRLEADHFALSDPESDMDIIEDPFVLPSLIDGKLSWPTLEKK